MPEPLLDILFMDDDLVAVNKPPGIKVHRGRADRREKCYLLQRLRDQIGRRLYPVHRLDRPTSGVVVFGLSPGSSHEIAKCFSGKIVQKIYLAVVRGHVALDGLIDAPLNRVDDRGRRCEDLQPAVTRYRCLETAELPVAVSRHPTSRYSLVEVHPETGRMHQIRRHFRRISHPIIGDRQHGDNRHNRFFATDLGVGRMLLAAVELRLPHPRTGEPLRLVAPVDAPFHSIIDRMEWRQAVPVQWTPKTADGGIEG